LKTNNGKGK
jgi:hypothetical protein